VSVFKRMRQQRGHRFLTPKVWFVILSLIAGLVVFSTGRAQADAGNPIVGSTFGEAVTDPSNGSVTVFIKGQWNWQTHTTDCNFDRAGAGAGIVWNDPSEPGFSVGNQTPPVEVGIKSLRSGDTKNVVDRMVHPADRGNAAAPPASYPNGQAFRDPAPNFSPVPVTSATESGTTVMLTTAPHGLSPNDWVQVAGVSVGGYNVTTMVTVLDDTHLSYAAKAGLKSGTGGTVTDLVYKNWKGGCGTEPFSSFPMGSWGYEKSGPGPDGSMHQGYSHTFAKQSDVSKVCVNFYDVHGGGKAGTTTFQAVNNNNEITVDANSDNSIQTNKFNVLGGSCLFFPTISTQLSCTNTCTVADGSSVTDTETISGGFNPSGTVTYNVYKDDKCTVSYAAGVQKAFAAGGSVPQSAPVTFNAAGTYYWQAVYSGNNQNAGAVSPCGSEVVNVNKNPISISTALVTTPPQQPPASAIGAGVYDTTTLGNGASDATGTVTYTVYENADCTHEASTGPAGELDNQPGTVTVSGGVVPQSPLVHFNIARQYWWNATYSGDEKYSLSSSDCASEPLTVNPNTTSIHTVHSITPNDTATFNGIAPGTGGTVTFYLYPPTDPNCASPTAAYTSPPISVPANGTYGTSNTTHAFQDVGTWKWKVVYSGDNNNAPTTSACGVEQFTITNK